MVCSMKHPFGELDLYKLIESIKSNDPEPLPETVSPFIKELMSELLDKNPNTRPDAAYLL